MNLKIAVEYERGLHYPNGHIANLAPQFLSHPLNKNKKETPYFQLEATLHQNEYNSPARESLDDLCQDLLEAEEVSGKICEDLGVVNIPISETGAGKGECNPHPKVTARRLGYQTIFGQEAEQKLEKLSGIHFHIDQYQPRLVDQYNLLQALLPTIAFTSTSSISYERKNSENCHRYRLLADPMVGALAAIPEERGYIQSIEDLTERNETRYRKWKSAFDVNCWKYKLPEDYDFKKHFNLPNTGWPDIRFRPDIGDGTFELRISDTTTIDILQGQAALIMGYITRVIKNNIPVSIAKDNGAYKFSSKEIVLPNEKTLLKYTAGGVENTETLQYLKSLEKFSRGGLKEDEQRYLDPIKKITNTGRNVATQILDYLGHQKQYTAEEAAQANLFVWRLQRAAIRKLKRDLRK